MKRNILKITVIACMLVLVLGAIHAQTKVILDETLLTQESFDRFTAVSVIGDNHIWNFSSQYGAMMSGYTNPNSYENEDWFISPAMDLTTVENVTLTFDHTRGSAAVINVGIAEGWYKVFATANYTGDPTTTTWVELEGVNHSMTAWWYVSSGVLTIPANTQSKNSRIAFKYLSSDYESATWEIKNMLVEGDEIPLPPDPSAFKFTTFNAEWLSCTSNGPSDEELQMNNLATLITSMNSDVVALQEVGTSSYYATVDTLVKRLGVNDWGGSIVPTGSTPYSNCGQYTAIVYKKSRVQFVSASAITTSSKTPEGDSYSWCWSGGRYPIKYEVNLSTTDGIKNVIFVNVHAKAMSDEISYTRRKGGSYLLKGILDGSAYNTKNLVFLGDFNDYLNGSMTASQSESPYYNFISDFANYQGLTGNIQQYNYNNPTIDNIIISNELFDNYVQGSAVMEIEAANAIPNFDGTTSNNHRPVSASFSFGFSGTDAVNYTTKQNLTIYPNPVKTDIQITYEGTIDRVEVYAVTGQLMLTNNTSNTLINVQELASGSYFIRIFTDNGVQVEKFVKE